MGRRGTGLRRKTRLWPLGGLGAGVGLAVLLAGVGTVANAQPGNSTSVSLVAHAATSTHKTAFQCEKAFHNSQARAQCFNQLPGANCAHPLEVQKAGPTTRGASRYFKLTFNEEPDGEGALQYYSWAPKQNVAICPYPSGAVYKVSLLYLTLPNGETLDREHDIHNYPEHTSASGGEFSFIMSAEPVKSWYLVVKGYFIHPLWQRHG
jgi:hypothetical protein